MEQDELDGAGDNGQSCQRANGASLVIHCGNAKILGSGNGTGTGNANGVGGVLGELLPLCNLWNGGSG
jgi:hypothetical protein